MRHHLHTTRLDKVSYNYVNIIKVNNKVKFALEQATKTQRCGADVQLDSLNSVAKCRWVDNTTSRPLYPREWPGIHCTAGWVGHRAGAEYFVPTGIPSPDRPVRSEWLHRLSYPGPPCRCLAKSTYSLSYRLQERVLTVTFAIRHAGIYKEQRYSMSPPTMNVLQQIHTEIKASKFFHCPTVICNQSNVYSDENFPSYNFSSLQFVHLNKS